MEVYTPHLGKKANAKMPQLAQAELRQMIEKEQGQQGGDG
jgi:hypothetical protein